MCRGHVDEGVFLLSEEGLLLPYVALTHMPYVMYYPTEAAFSAQGRKSAVKCGNQTPGS